MLEIEPSVKSRRTIKMSHITLVIYDERASLNKITERFAVVSVR